MEITPSVEKLARAIEAVDSPGALFPLAAQAASIAVTAAEQGPPLVAHLVLAAMATSADDALDYEAWQRMVETSNVLAAYLRGSSTLSELAKSYLAHASPETLQ